MEHLFRYNYNKGSFKHSHRMKYLNFMINNGVITNTSTDRNYAIKTLEESRKFKNSQKVSFFKKHFNSLNLNNLQRYIIPSKENSIPNEKQIILIANNIVNFIYDSKMDHEKPNELIREVMRHHLNIDQINRVDVNQVILALQIGYNQNEYVDLNFLIERSKGFRPMNMDTVHWIESLKKIKQLEQRFVA